MTIERDHVLRQLVIDVDDLLGQEAGLAARYRAYKKSMGMPNGPEGVRVFQDAYKRELRQLLHRH